MMTYLLQVSTCWIVFYGIYLLFLQKETFFSINRYYLLSALMAGLVIPFLGGYLPANHTSTEIYQVMHHISSVEISPQVENKTSILTWENILYTIYILGALIVFSRLIYGLSRIYSIYRGAEKTVHKTFTLVESNMYHLPFSFFHLIFISKQLQLNKDVEKVLKHEELHATQWHSLDIIATELLQVFFWFNPILIFYKHALRQSHEFLADAYVTQDHNRSSYGQLLLRQSTSGLEIALANHFFHSQIKKRITMMYKEKSKRPAMVKYLMAIPVLIVLLILFASNKADENATDNKALDCMDISIDEEGKLIFKDQETEFILLANQIKNESQNCILLDVKDKKYNQQAMLIYNLALKNNLDVHLRNEYYNSELISASKDLFGAKDVIQDAFEDQGDPIFKVVEEMPRFPGCEEGNGTPKEKEECAKQKMLEFIYKNVTYPATAKKANIQGMCIIQFIIEKDGTINDAKIARDIGGECGTEALRTVNSFPNWIPGKQKGEVVRVQYTLPVKFQLESELPQVEEAEPIVQLQNMSVNMNMRYFRTFTDIKRLLIATKNKVDCKIQNYRLVHAPKDGTVAFVNTLNSEKFSADVIKLVRNAKVGDYYFIEDISASCTGETETSYLGNIKILIDNKQFDLSSNQVVEVPESDVFKVVEEMPRFPGCEKGNASAGEKYECSKKYMLEYIYKNLKYPEAARNENIEGMVVIQFIIEKDGSVNQAKIVREVGGGCGDEALKVVNTFPKWIPGKQQGKKVRVQYTLPVKFKLEGGTQKSDKKKLNVPNIVAFGEASDKAKKDNLVKISQEQINSENGDVFAVVEEMPRFAGCEDSGLPNVEKEECSRGKMLQFIYTNLKYPKEARKLGVDGMAVVQIIIEKDGSISSSKILRDPGAGTGTEAKRVIDLMPNWIPGKQKGQNVRVKYVIPIKYKLEGDDKSKSEDRPTEELKVQQLKVMPNPSNGMFVLAFTIEDKTPANITFHSMNGQILETIEKVNLPFTKTIDLSAYKGQTVLMSITQNGKIYSDKIIVQ